MSMNGSGNWKSGVSDYVAFKSTSGGSGYGGGCSSAFAAIFIIIIMLYILSSCSA